jgi:ABC-type dipeptide/oligopeptide/nickel transport system permease component
VVKNFGHSYDWNTPDGVPYRALLRPRSVLSSHVLSHIYANAHYQYIPSLKEHASFLITGLIIIEMALNIQGHLGYELLQTILYREFEVTVVIITSIFLVVKGTEIAIDVWSHRVSMKYENKR